MITFHLHNLREFVRMTTYHEFDYKPLTVLCSLPDECIFSITDDNGVPVRAKIVWRVNVGNVG